MADPEDQFGEVLLVGGSRDDEVLSRRALEEIITLPVGSGVERYKRTGEYQQIRGVDQSEPFRRFWLYEYKDPDA